MRVSPKKETDEEIKAAEQAKIHAEQEAKESAERARREERERAERDRKEAEAKAEQKLKAEEAWKRLPSRAKIHKDLYRYQDLQVLGYGCRTKIWQMVKRGKFPCPIDDGNGNPVWIPEEVHEWKSTRPRIHYGHDHAAVA